MKNFFQNFISKNGIQPILTLVLIFVIIGIAFGFFSQNNQKTDTITEVAVIKKVTFDEAANAFLNGNYEIYTRGSLYIRDRSAQSVDPQSQNKSTPTPSITTISLVENKYEDVFFLSSKGEIRKIDAKTFGINGSIFFNSKGELVFLDNVNKQYTLYPIPADNEIKVVQLFDGIKVTFKENLFPIIPLLNDYKDKKFNPVENSRLQNIYSGKWQHPVYTNNEVSTVVIQTDANTGLFSSMYIANTNPPSQLYFDFRNVNSLDNFDAISGDYKSIKPLTEYKTK